MPWLPRQPACRIRQVRFQAEQSGKHGDIPGVEGVGKKGATELLNRFGSLHGIFEPEVAHGEKVKGALKKVLEQREQAELSVRLATLQHDVELGLSLKDLRYQETTRS